MSEGRGSSHQYRNSRLYQYQRERRKFAVTVYCVASTLVLGSIAQWIPMILLSDIKKIFHDYFYISIIGLLVALLAVTVFIFYENIRFYLPINWILAILIVEGITFGLARIVIESSLFQFFICFATVTFVVIMCISVGILISHDLTLDVVILFICAVLFFIGSVFFIMLHIVVGTPYSLYIYSGFVIITVVLFVMYHAQTINGGRYAEMRLNDYLMAALIIYHDFVILLMLTLYLLSKIL